MPIIIPADLSIITLKTQARVLPQRFTPQAAKSLLEKASRLLQERAQISFSLASCEAPSPIELPPNMTGEAIDDNGFHFLVSHFKAGRGVRALFVDKIARQDIGGSSREDKRVCVVGYNANIELSARMLAHEFGHLLGIKMHINEGKSAGPGEEGLILKWRKNLMYSGLLEPDAELDTDQINTMTTSVLAKQFGG